MDTQRDEAFEAEFAKTNFYKGMVESLKNSDCPLTSIFEMRNGKYRNLYIQLASEIWQADKTNTVEWFAYETQSPRINGRYLIFAQGEQFCADFEIGYGFSSAEDGTAFIQELITHWAVPASNPIEVEELQ
ncbi:hypothetical protein AMD27_06760 [Acinetobacter sp. TGL-Y2]|uniref:hypothetical protein n=1 Tax=Acinetobacter sp. TGL-Y2 TaxID=1407071 RepID=UPI0007A64B67|nr:hypothetical protein [Acinetobacter sp. TGL-Y2]AMW78613.1 hypothetical protein AMD27_06760 [Acinetobacter sp. TGL-Y2]